MQSMAVDWGGWQACIYTILKKKKKIKIKKRNKKMHGSGSGGGHA